MNIDEIREKLQNNIMVVEFTKKNGDLRRMICTTRTDFIPQVFGQSVPNDEIVTVWDIEAQGWRSFRMDALISSEIQE